MAEERSFDLLGVLKAFLKLVRWMIVLGLGALAVEFVADFIINLLFISSGCLN